MNREHADDQRAHRSKSRATTSPTREGQATEKLCWREEERDVGDGHEDAEDEGEGKDGAEADGGKPEIEDEVERRSRRGRRATCSPSSCEFEN